VKQHDPVTEPITFELSEEDLQSISGGGVDAAALAVNPAGGFAIRNHALNLNGGFAIRNHALNLNGGFAIRNHALNLAK
jgi:bacteriocin-like protein